MKVIGFSLGLVIATGVLLAQDAPVSGDPVHGRSIFEGSGGCLACHKVLDKGSRLGPDLSDIGARRTADALQKALLEPNPEVQPQNKLYRVVTRDGNSVTGKLLNQDQFSLQMLDNKERLVAFQKSNLREYGFIPTPPMPSYRSKLSAQEITDLVSYLASLKGAPKE